MANHKNCDHDRHQPYLHIFNENTPDWTYLRHISRFVLDPNLSPEDPEDLELFQDLLFDGPMGQIHIFYYETMFPSNRFYYPKEIIRHFVKYLSFLNKLSPLFVRDAYYFIFRRKSQLLINQMLDELPFEIKMDFIREAQKQPDIIELSDKLKMYNLFS